MPATADHPLAPRVAELHEQGLGRNAIAKEMGVGGRIVSEVAKALGLTFDRSSTRVATAARVADSQERRAALAARILNTADKTLERLERLRGGDVDSAMKQARALNDVARAVESTMRAVPVRSAEEVESQTLLAGLAETLQRMPDTYVPADELPTPKYDDEE